MYLVNTQARYQLCSKLPESVHGGPSKSTLDSCEACTSLPQRYTVEYGLLYERSGGVRLAGFTDVDWAGCAEDRKSTSGCCFSIGSGIISWFSRKQHSVALSSA
jgi:hypothetical protein